MEPLFTFAYVRAMCSLGEEVVASLRRDLFRALLVQRVQFFDSHRAVWTHGYCSPRHQAHVYPPFLG